MKKFAKRYDGIAVLIFLAVLVLAFVIGALVSTRWTPDSGVDQADLPSPLLGGFAGAFVVVLYSGFGLLLRVAAYFRLQRTRPGNGKWWWYIAAGESAYGLFNLWILWVASKPTKDPNFALLYMILGAGAATIVSIILAAMVFYKTRPQTLHGLHEE